MKLLDWLSYLPTAENLRIIYNRLRNNSLFRNAVRRAVRSGIEVGLRYLKDVKQQLIKECRENTELIGALAKISFKAITKNAMLNAGGKQAIKCGITKAGSHGIKTAMKVTNPAGIIVDVTQAGLELAGYKKEGKAVGLLGNLGTGACTGFMVAGPVGATIGACASLGTWIVAEAAGNALETTLSD